MALTPLDFPASPTNGQTYPNPPVTGQPTYQWDAATGVWLSKFALGEEYVQLDGGQPMTGLLTLSGNPTAPMHAATKSYVDSTEKGRKNYIINGAMMVSQENGGALSAANGFYAADQFYMSYAYGGAVEFSQAASVTPAGSPNRIRVKVTTIDAAVAAGDFIIVRQPLEGLRIADLMMGTAAAKTITLQFGVRAPAGTYSIVFNQSTNARVYAAEYVISAGEANTDVIKSVTLTLDTTGTWPKDNTLGLDIYWSLMCGTTYQLAPGSWASPGSIRLGSTNQFNFMGTVGNVFELFDVSLTEGSVAPPFQVPDYPSELALCQRYWRWLPFNMYFVAGAVDHSLTVPITFSMRSAPTIGTIVANPALAQTSANNKSNAFSNVTASDAAIGLQALAAGACYVTGYRSSANARL